MMRRLTLTAMILSGTVLFHGQALASGASLFFSPSSTSVSVGGTVTIAVKVNSGGQAINSAEGTISFSKDKLRLTSVSKSSSIFSFWAVGPSGSNATGQVVFSGGLPSPGYTGSSGTMITMTFQALAAGTANLTLSGGKVLANDGLGTDILSSVGTGTVTVKSSQSSGSTSTKEPAPTVSSVQYPDQHAWYTLDTATISWTKPAGALEYSYDFRQSATNEPDHVADTKDTSVTVHLTSDGVWYFALQAHYRTGWSATTRYKLQYDHTAPDPFTVIVERDRGANDPTPQLTFSAKDATSGIANYTLSIDGGVAVSVTNPVTVSDLGAGDHTFVITAYDRAGNTRSSQVSTTQVGYPAPVLTSVTTSLLLLEPLVVKGTAAAGDIVTIFINGQSIGQAVAGVADPEATSEGVRVTTPWTFTADRLLRPGHYQLTAVATSVDGQTSVPTDPVAVTVNGHSLVIAGHVLATVAILPAGVIVLGLLAAVIFGIMGRLAWSVVRLHQHDRQIEEELDDIRKRIRKGQLTGDQTDSALTDVEQQLLKPSRPKNPRRRPRR